MRAYGRTVMSKQFTPRKTTVRLAADAARPSKIRREPPPPRAQRAPQPFPSENEVWVVSTGVILFALAIVVIIFGVSEYTK